MTASPDFHDIVEQFYQPLYRFAWSLAKNENDASDLAQQTFLIWAEKGEALRDKSKVKSWLFTTLYREFLRIHRRKKGETLTEDNLLEIAAPDADPDNAQKLDAEGAVNALHQLEPAYREPLILFYLEDISYREIADILDIPIGTVMSRLSRGKARLKQILSENP